MDLKSFSDALAGAVATAAARVVTITAEIDRTTSGFVQHAARDDRTTSGFIWKTGQIVTSDGALDDAESFSVTLADGKSIKATLKGRDPSTDVVLLEAKTGEFAEWAAAPLPAVGSLALVVGQGEASPIATHGIVAEVGPAWQSLHGGKIDARIRLGLWLGRRSEGGVAVAADGALLGMAVSAPMRSNLVIPTTTVARAVDALAKAGHVSRGFLGVSLHPLGAHSEQKGVIVVDIEPGSPAATAGIVVGDILTTWNGDALAAPRDVLRKLGTDSAGSTATIGISRGGSASEVTVTIGERPRS